MTRAISSETGLAENRRLTEYYIAHDPTTITLIPVKQTRQPGGGFKAERQTPRSPQQFKVVAVINNWDGIAAVQGGEVQGWAYILVGQWDAEIAIGDLWEDGDNTYRVTAILQASDYEKRCAVSSFGPEPSYG
jgi:hypothetical protein